MFNRWRKSAKEASGGFDFLVVGLGNPGRQYESTRHNVGFMCLDLLAETRGFTINKLKFKSLMADVRLGGHRVLLLKPQTFMNLSGEAVREAAAFYKIPPEKVLIIFDDISLPPGKIRIRKKGSDGGHNGIKNILYHLGSDAFPRIKIGVGEKAHPDQNLAGHVLSGFTKADAPLIREALQHALEAMLLMLDGETDKAMNQYN